MSEKKCYICILNINNMQFEIVEFEDLSGPVAHIYSLMPQGSGRTLLEEFFDENKVYSDELREIYEKIDTMADRKSVV